MRPYYEDYDEMIEAFGSEEAWDEFVAEIEADPAYEPLGIFGVDDILPF